MMKRGFTEQSRLFLNSFKLKKIFLKTLLYDLLFFIISIVSIRILSLMLNNLAAKVDLAQLNQAIITPNQAQLALVQNTLTDAKAVVWALGISIILYLAIILLAWSFSKAKIYTLLLKQKFNNIFYWKFTLLNLVFYIPLLLILLAFIYVVKELPQSFYVLIIILLSFSYIMTLSYIIFTKNNNVFRSIGGALEFGFTKIHKMLMPIILIILIFLIISFISANLLIKNLSITLQPYISILIFLIYINWSRIYFIKAAIKANI